MNDLLQLFADTLKSLKERKLCKTAKEFSRVWLGQSQDYLAVMKARDDRPGFKPLFCLHHNLSKRGIHDLATAVHLKMVEEVETRKKKE